MMPAQGIALAWTWQAAKNLEGEWDDKKVGFRVPGAMTSLAPYLESAAVAEGLEDLGYRILIRGLVSRRAERE
ncbi:hypothetical protein TrVFT333_001873 [Trichoderma virens FT-333]|nr:hypothetical protein TrVFT333_001873 [Trichoderma virens FT-333]